MEPSFTSVVLVNNDFKALTDRFLVETTPKDLIVHPKMKVKEERPDELSPYRRSDIRVWKTMGAKKLSEEVKLASLELSNFQSLLVQLPAVDLMKQKGGLGLGWKYCPSCKTRVQKVTGPNHMSCMTPACNTHFCYCCGGLIVKSALGQEIKEATRSHYSSTSCPLFEVPGE